MISGSSKLCRVSVLPKNLLLAIEIALLSRSPNHSIRQKNWLSWKAKVICFGKETGAEWEAFFGKYLAERCPRPWFSFGLYTTESLN